MAVLSLDDLFRALKRGAPDPVYYLHGDEDVLKEDALDALRDAVLDASTRDFNYDIRQAADVDAEALDALVDTPPMLAEQRLVVIRGIEAWKAKSPPREHLQRYLLKPNPTTVLVLVQAPGAEPAADIGRGVTAVNLEPLAPERAVRWVAHRAKRINLTLAPEAAEHLTRAVAGDLSAIAAELDKLAGAAGSSTVSVEDVARLVGVRHGETAYDLVDAALGREGAHAARLVRPVLSLAEWTGVRLLTLLGTMLLGVALARAELDRGRRGSALESALVAAMRRNRPRNLRRWEDEAANWARWAERWTAGELADAIQAAALADAALKSTTLTDEAGIVEQLVLTFAVRKEAAA